jgi:hypothetical protein
LDVGAHDSIRAGLGVEDVASEYRMAVNNVGGLVLKCQLIPPESECRENSQLRRKGSTAARADLAVG